MTIIEQIKDFVKSQLEDNKRLSKENSIFAACGSEDETILRFLDTLESEKPMNQEGLEAEIQRVVENYNKLVNGSKVMKPSGIEKIARHFAKWGAEHLKQ